MAWIISTTSSPTLPVAIALDDLGLKPIATPFTDLNLNEVYGFTNEEISVSQSLTQSIEDGYVIAIANGDTLDSTTINDFLNNPAIIPTGSSTGNIEGGTATSVYTPDQTLDGGGA
jgi:hypothetical protein